MKRRVLPARKLAHYRAHFREAAHEDGVVCLECGRLFKALGSHVRVHAVTIDEYRARWGYNRTNPLVTPESHEKRRQAALAHGLPALVPPDSQARALEARRGVPWPHRPESRLAQREAGAARVAAGWRQPGLKAKDAALRSLAAQGITARDVAARTGLSRRHVRKRLRALGLGAALATPFRPSEKDLRLLALRQEGLWSSEIAARMGVRVGYVGKRLRVLRRRGVTVPPPAGPRPNAGRRVSDDAILALAREGLQPRELAVRVGLGAQTVRARLERFRKRGLLPGGRRRPPVPARELAHYRAHIREAVQEDGVICLDCGGVYNALPSHVRVHALTIEEYKAQWGYNRRRALNTPAVSETRRQMALAHNLPALGPRDALAKGRDAWRHTRWSPRLESRLDQKDTATARIAAGWQRPDVQTRDDVLRALADQGLTAREIAVRTGRHYHHTRHRLRALGLHQALARPVQLRDKDRQLVALREEGLWAGEIAARAGLSAHYVTARLRVLRERGVSVAPPAGPRPNAWRRVSDDAIVALVREGLRIKEVAARVGLGGRTVAARIRRLRRTGLRPRRGAAGR